MATSSIEISGMKTLVESVETAIDGIPSDRGSVRTQLDRVMLSTQPLALADNVIAWLQSEVAGLRRRLALAISIEASTPGVQSFVQLDESGQLRLESPGRDPNLHRDIGNGPDARNADVGFHLIADSLGGPTNRLNVLPGNGKPIDDGLANLNQGQYATMERSALVERLRAEGSRPSPGDPAQVDPRSLPPSQRRGPDPGSTQPDKGRIGRMFGRR